MVGNLHSGNKGVSKSPYPGQQGWHGKGSQQRQKGILWIVEVLPNRRVEGETELSRVAGYMLKTGWRCQKQFQEQLAGSMKTSKLFFKYLRRRKNTRYSILAIRQAKIKRIVQTIQQKKQILVCFIWIQCKGTWEDFWAKKPFFSWVFTWMFTGYTESPVSPWRAED